MPVSYNELIKYKGIIHPSDDWKNNAQGIIQSMSNGKPKYYSYSLYVDEHDGHISYRLELMYSLIDKYNTISVNTIIDKINTSIEKYQKGNSNKLIGYKQPPLDILIRTYEPLVIHLSKQQHEHWKEIEQEDLEQMCRLVICILYNSGYYIHKKLIAKTFNNYVLQYLRHDRYRPKVISLEEPIPVKGENLTVKDAIKDEDYEQQLIDKEDRDSDIAFLTQFRSIVIQEIGERQYEQLLKQYSTKTTTAWACKKVFDLRKKFNKNGVVKKLKGRYNI